MCEEYLAFKVLYVASAKPKSKNQSSSDNESFKNIQHLLQEYEILVLLNYSNIIRIFGFCFGDENHSHSILLQFCPNNLKDVAKDMEDFEKVCAIYEICNGMNTVHEANLIHRDLKPENILIDEK